jgi:dihydropteroate synthase
LQNAQWPITSIGLQDPEMISLAAASQKECVVMHHVSIPASKQQVLPHNIDVINYLLHWAEMHFSFLESHGIKREKIIFDPGIGFGKTAEQSLAIIKHIAEFKKLNTRILVGHSRKSFFASFTDKPASERDIETVATSLYLNNQPVDYLRVHNVEMTSRAFQVAKALQ